MWETVDILATGGGKGHPHSNAAVPPKTAQSPNAVAMLCQRQRLWVNIETALGECRVFANLLAQSIQLTQCWIGVGPAS